MSTVVPNLCAKKCPLTIAHSAVSENATYAVLFDGSGDSGSFGTRLPDDLFANCQSDGGDICFTSDLAGTTQLAVELVAISTSGKTCEIWVPVALKTASDVVIYVWYKSKSGTLSQPAAAGTYGSQAVWTAVGSVAGVWHLNSTSPTDSTGINSTTNHGGTAATGKIGGGLQFNGSSTYVDCGTPLTAHDGWTIQGWFNNVSGGWTALGLGNDGSIPDGGVLPKKGSTVQCYQSNVYADSSVATPSGLFFAAQTRTSSTAGTLNINGTSHTANPSGVTSTDSMTLNIGRWSSGLSLFWSGIADEVRIHSVARSANWLATDYAIQSSTSLVTPGTPVSTFSPAWAAAVLGA